MLERMLKEALKAAKDAKGRDIGPAIVSGLATLIRDEVKSDPEHRGYAGRGASEIAGLLNNEFQVQRRRPAPLARLAHPDVPPAFATLTDALGHQELGHLVEDEIRTDPTRRGYIKNVGDPARVLELLSQPWYEVVQVLPPRWPRLIQGLSFVPSKIGAGDVADLLGLSDG